MRNLITFKNFGGFQYNLLCNKSSAMNPKLRDLKKPESGKSCFSRNLGRLNNRVKSTNKYLENYFGYESEDIWL